MATVPSTAKKPSDRKRPTANQRRQAEESAQQFAPIELNGEVIRVAHPQTWRASSMASLNGGDIFGWGDKNVHPDDRKAFRNADPTFGEVREFIEAANEYFGSDQGE